ncbi:Crz [Drosophila busckii]|uniref:Pro-corazonin n=1 Tax=Drosophila busckii TaxID=30019 RepID=A0A0M3QX83_DROBS|nr:pro-corazonin [Drosophila busckii]ALC45483.1 Crz [Drosophila busckii]
MFRLLLLPLFFFTLSMVCMGQTFQYSRGWTNGKRASSLTATPLNNGHNVGLADLYDFQDSPIDRRMERCLMQLQHFLHHAPGNGFSRPEPERDSELRDMKIRSRIVANSNHNDNNLFTSPNRQSNEIFEALNTSGSDAIDPNDYNKH